MSLPLVLGLSHLFGEAIDLDGQAAFWGGHGFASDFALQLPVSAQKRQILLARPAETVALRYLKWSGGPGVPGLEFLRHEGEGAAPAAGASPLLSLFMKASAPEVLVDAGKNRVVLDPRLAAATTVVVKVSAIAPAAQYLRQLGLVSCAVESRERQVLLGDRATSPEDSQAWMLHHRLFAQLAVRLLLVKDAGAEPRPLVDRRGWSGLSFLTASLDAVHRQLPLTAPQTIERPPPHLSKEVAFFNEAGILTEFLALNRQREA